MGAIENQTLHKLRRESKVMSFCTFHFLSICMDSMTWVNATFPTIFFFFPCLKTAFLEQWAFSLENNCLCSTYVFAQPSLLYWSRYEIVHSSVKSYFKISPGSTDAINIRFDQLKNMVAFTKSSVWDDFVLIVQHCWCRK